MFNIIYFISYEDKKRFEKSFFLVFIAKIELF